MNQKTPPSGRPTNQNENKATYEFTLQKKYLDFIKDGSKTVEGRIGSGAFRNMKVGETIKFFDPKNPNNFVIVEVTQNNHYKTFRDMLVGEGVDKMLPDTKTVDEGVKIYERIPNYLERCKKSGCVGIGVKVLAKSN